MQKAFDTLDQSNRSEKLYRYGSIGLVLNISRRHLTDRKQFDAFDKDLQMKGHCKHLGIQIDSKLNFKDHIYFVTKNLNGFSGLMYNKREDLGLRLNELRRTINTSL